MKGSGKKLKTNYLKEVMTLLSNYKQGSKIQHEKSIKYKR